MKVHATAEPGLIVASIEGRFDVHGIEGFNRSVVDAVDAAHPSVIVDLSQVEFMDSSALAGLVRTLKATVSHGGTITLVAISDAARIILELTRLDAVFPAEPTLADARRRVLAAA